MSPDRRCRNLCPFPNDEAAVPIASRTTSHTGPPHVARHCRQIGPCTTSSSGFPLGLHGRGVYSASRASNRRNTQHRLLCSILARRWRRIRSLAAAHSLHNHYDVSLVIRQQRREKKQMPPGGGVSRLGGSAFSSRLPAQARRTVLLASLRSAQADSQGSSCWGTCAAVRRRPLPCPEGETCCSAKSGGDDSRRFRPEGPFLG